MNFKHLVPIFGMLFAPTLYAAAISWNNLTTGDWNTPGNWSPAQVPTAIDAVTINNGGTAELTALPDAAANSLILGEGVAESGRLTVRNVNLTMSGLLRVAQSGNGTLVISNGGKILAPNDTFQMAQDATSVGSVTVTGTGSELVAETPFFLANAGNGTMVVEDGSHVTKIADALRLTIGATGTGTLNLNGTSGRRGLVTCPQLFAGPGNHFANFNGGILQANVDEPAFISGFTGTQLNIQAGGLTIDSQTFDIGTSNGLSGVGPLRKRGSGRLKLSGINTYGGSTTVEEGTLRIDTASSLPSNTNLDLSASGATLDLSPAASTFTVGDLSGVAASAINLGASNLRFGTSNSTSLASAISGIGGMTKQGIGSVTFSGDSTYTGPTQLDAGTLDLRGSIRSPTIVGPAATLRGTGTISNTLSVSGRLRAGRSVGTLNVAGPVTFNTGSTFDVELDPAQASLLNVTAGGVTINPGVDLSILPNPGIYLLGSTYTIIQTAEGVVVGTFSTVTNTMPLLVFTVIYTPNTVLLNLGRVPNGLSNLVGGSLAKCLDNANPTFGSDFNNVISQLIFEPNAEVLQHALNQMQPSQYNAFQLTQENNNTRVLSVLSGRAEQLHRACKPQEQTWGVWFDAFGDFLNQEHQHGQYGFHAATGAALAGIDGHASPHLHLGLGGAYTWTHLNWAGSHGNSHISSGYGFAYGTWNVRHFFLDASFVGGYNSYEAKRHIGFLAIDRHVKSNHHGYTLAGRLTGGFPFKAWKAEVAPVISLDYDFLHQSGFKEHGAQSLNLRIHEKNANLLRAEAGFRVTRRCPPELQIDPCTQQEVCVSDARWLPSFQLTVIREWRFQGERYRSRLQDLNCTFTTKGLNPDRTLIAPAIGITYLAGDRIELTLDYAGEFDVDGKYWDQKGNFQISYAF